jgi:DNA-directed RNA polymerase subunit RPC12/RpoP
MHHKPITECPQCGHVVEWDTVHSGGVILYRCCNCHHLVEKIDLQTMEKEYAASAKD